MTHGPANTHRTQNLEQRTEISNQGLLRTKDFNIQQESKFQACPPKLQRRRVPSSKFINEFWKLIRFGFVGVSTFAIQFALYFVFSRYLMPDIPVVFVYVLAMGFAITENYIAHRIWTFGDHAIPKNSVLRYVTVVIFALILNTVIFWLGHNIFRVYDLIVVIFANLAVPFVTYAGHRLFTFKSR